MCLRLTHNALFFRKLEEENVLSMLSINSLEANNGKVGHLKGHGVEP